MLDLKELTNNKHVDVLVHKIGSVWGEPQAWTCTIEHKEDGVNLKVEVGKKETLEEAVEEAVAKYRAIRPHVPEFYGMMIEETNGQWGQFHLASRSMMIFLSEEKPNG